MRDIEFRAWEKKSKKMFDLKAITPLALDDTMNTQLAIKGGSGLFIPFLEDLEIMQYIGLRDINSKRIFEGDTLKYKPVYIEDVRYTKGKGFVKFKNCCFQIIKDSFAPGLSKRNVKEYEIEIIGNIYEGEI